MTTKDRIALARLRGQLKRNIAESRRRHGIWAKWHKTNDWRRRHRSYLDWKRAVAASAATTRQIHAIEARYATGASHCSLDLAKAVAIWEGGRASDGLFRPYRDAVGVWTIGYGHTSADGAPVPGPGTNPLTAAEATTLLLHDLNVFYAPAVAAAGKRFGLKFTQKEFDALTSFAYNLGPGYFSPPHDIGIDLERHDMGSLASAMLEYDHAGGQVLAGLSRRRRWEAQLLRGGTYHVS